MENTDSISRINLFFNKNKAWLLFILCILILFSLFIFAYIFLIPGTNRISDNSQTNQNNITVTTNNAVTITPTFIPKPLEYSAWIPNWASPSGLSSVKANPGLFTSLSPVWYEVNEDGTLKTTFPKNRNEIIEYSKENKIKLYPTIAMFDHELFTKVLQDQTILDKHIQHIVEAAKLYDGIDMDYESTKFSDKEKYFELLTKLKKEFTSINKRLIVTVIAKWGDDILYPSLPETRQVQDWQMISGLADEVRIMAYDYTYSKSYFPGPIAPLGWVTDVIEYALTKLPKDKIVLGIHLYSYEWSITATNPYDFIVDMSANLSGEKTANSYTYETIKNILNDHQGEVSEFDGESIFRYVSDGNKKTLVYQTPQQVQTRLALAKEFGIKGVVFWRLGGESELLKK